MEKERPIEKIENPNEKMREYLEDYKKYKQNLIMAAALVREKAVSHRNPPFKVGCALMTKDQETEDQKGEYSVYAAHNFKPIPGEVKGDEKRCAERNAVEDAINFNLKIIIAMVTVSRETATGDETKAHDALHPCRDCRDLLRELKEKDILKDESIICSVNDSRGLDNLVEEEMTAKQILDIYKDDLEK